MGGNYWTTPNPGGGSCTDKYCSYTCLDLDGDGVCDSSCDVGTKAADYDYLPLTDNVNQCIQVIDNGDPEDKIDVVFVPDGFMTEGEMDTFANSILPLHISGSSGILTREPFLSDAARFNFYYFNESDNFSCRKSADCRRVDIEYLLSIRCPIVDEIIVLVNSTEYFGYAYTTNGFAVSTSGPLSGTAKAEQITSHEFGHSFGGLKDEYANLRTISETSYPNCDEYGCPKWCSVAPAKAEPPWDVCDAITIEADCDNSPICSWFSSVLVPGECTLIDYSQGNFTEGLTCIEGAECYHNCHGTNGFRSSLNSLMSGYVNDAFNEVSQTHIENIFKCCYPVDQPEFLSVNCSDWNNNNSNRYAGCTTYG